VGIGYLLYSYDHPTPMSWWACVRARRARGAFPARRQAGLGAGGVCHRPVQGQALHFSAAPRGWRIERAFNCRPGPHSLAKAGRCSLATVPHLWGTALCSMLGRGMYLGPYDYRLSLGSEWGLKRLCGRREGQPGAHPR